MRPAKIVSGGQSGVDRAALDVALSLGIPCGGWCPLGRWAENGRIGERYPLRETPSFDTSQRTEWNIRDADGTLVLACGDVSGGTALTIALAGAMNKPLLTLDLDADPDPDAVREWVKAHGIGVLNVAGPRESKCPGIYDRAAGFLRRVFEG